MSVERRRHPRVVINRELFDAQSSQLAHAENLSFRGVFLRQEEEVVNAVQAGDEVRVRFSVVADDMVTIEARGRVVRVSKKPLGVGVEFLALSPIMRAELRRVIRFQAVRDRWEAGEEVSRGEWEAARSSQVPAGLSNAEFASGAGGRVGKARRQGPPPLPPRLRRSLGMGGPGGKRLAAENKENGAEERSASAAVPKVAGDEVDEEAVTRVFYHPPADEAAAVQEASPRES